MSIKIGYCPLCDEEFEFETDNVSEHCPKCGHHLNLSERKDS